MGTIAKKTINDSEIKSKAIEILRFPLALMVVAIHCYYFNSQNINVLKSEWGGGNCKVDYQYMFYSTDRLCCSNVLYHKWLFVFYQAG